VLDRCKEPGSGAEPLAARCGQALLQAWAEKPGPPAALIGGRMAWLKKTSPQRWSRRFFDALARPDPPGRFTSASPTTSRRLSAAGRRPASARSPDFRAIVYWPRLRRQASGQQDAIKIIGDHHRISTPRLLRLTTRKEIRFSPPSRTCASADHPDPLLPPGAVRPTWVACHQLGFSAALCCSKRPARGHICAQQPLSPQKKVASELAGRRCGRRIRAKAADGAKHRRHG